MSIRTTLSLASLLIATSLHAEQTTAERMVDAAVAALPTTAATVVEFVPPHWSIHVAAEGDLDGDGRVDHVIDVTPDPDDPANRAAVDADDFFPAPDIVVVLFAMEGGGFRRVAHNSRLSTRNFDGRPFEMQIAKGVLVVHSNFGTGWATDVIYRFRYDAAAGRLMLIGYDHETYTRAGVDDAFATSENYLIGARIETTKIIDRRRNRKGVYRKEESKREKITKYKVAFEEVDYDDDAENREGRPFTER